MRWFTPVQSRRQLGAVVLAAALLLLAWYLAWHVTADRRAATFTPRHMDVGSDRLLVSDAVTAVNTDPTSFDKWLELGYAYYAAGRMRDAMKAFQKSAELDRHAAEPHMALGSCYFDLGWLNEAGGSFARAARLATTPTNKARAYDWLARAEYDLGRFVEAKRYWLISLKLAPRGFGAHVGLGQVALRQGDVAEAERCFRMASTVADGAATRAWAWWGLGRVAEERGDKEAARRSYKQALRCDPTAEYAVKALKRVSER